MCWFARRARRYPRAPTPWVGDLLDPTFLEKALEGIDKVYLLNAVTPDELTQALIAYDQLRN
jgi:uncharacterized protein YbjT (DUF2867 family)